MVFAPEAQFSIKVYKEIIMKKILWLGLLLSLDGMSYAMDDEVIQEALARRPLWYGRVHIVRDGPWLRKSYHTQRMEEKARLQIEREATKLEHIMKSTKKDSWSVLLEFTQNGKLLTRSYTVPKGMEECAKLELEGGGKVLIFDSIRPPQENSCLVIESSTKVSIPRAKL
jgi:hypothetical protein